MPETEFQQDVIDRLARIETQQKNITDECIPCRKKVDCLEVTMAKVEASAKAAHHRLDSFAELKKELTEAIKEQITGVYRTAIVVGSMTSFFVGIIISLIMMFITGYWGHVAK